MQLKALWSGRIGGKKATSKAVAHNAVRRHGVSMIGEGMAEIAEASCEQHKLARIDAEMAAGLALRVKLVAELSQAHAALVSFDAARTDGYSQIEAGGRVADLARRVGSLGLFLEDIRKYREVVVGVRTQPTFFYTRFSPSRDAMPRADEYQWYFD